MEFNFIEEKNANIIEPIGCIDNTTADEFGSNMKSFIGLGKKNYVVDMEKVLFISSAGLRVLVSSIKKIRQGGGKLVLCAMPENILEVFKIAGFDMIFTIATDRPKALSEYL